MAQGDISVSKPETTQPLAAPMPDRFYLRRCWEDACEEWGGHQKVELGAGFIGAISGGIFGVVYAGFTWAAFGGVLGGACVGFLIGLLFIFLYYLCLSPKRLDEQRQEKLQETHASIAKLKAALESERTKNAMPEIAGYLHDAVLSPVWFHPINRRDAKYCKVYITVKAYLVNLRDTAAFIKNFALTVDITNNDKRTIPFAEAGELRQTIERSDFLGLGKTFENLVELITSKTRLIKGEWADGYLLFILPEVLIDELTNFALVLTVTDSYGMSHSITKWEAVNPQDRIVRFLADDDPIKDEWR